MFGFWKTLREFTMGGWGRGKGGIEEEETRGGGIVKSGDLDSKQEEEHRSDEYGIEDEDGDQEDDEDDNNEEGEDDEDDNEHPVVTIHPDCGFTVDEAFECPLGSESRFTLAAIRESAMNGCPCCILHHAAVRSIAPEIPEAAEFSGSHDYIFIPFYVQDQKFVLAWADNGVDLRKAAYDEDGPPVCDFYGDVLGGLDLVERVVPCDTRSYETLATVQRWMQICDETHDCMEKRSSKLPRRVLDVRDNRIKLRETTPADEGSKYACLSHCWGKPSGAILYTSMSTLAGFYEEIPWDQLPRTFRDAVEFTRSLGLAFLWIDSLCIIQDSLDRIDWQEQSANMANIYQNAYVTLAAAASGNLDGGCYTRNDQMRLHRVGAPIAMVTYEDGTKRELFARRKFAHVESSLPLLKRGWVYQERVLSPRVLYFVGEELIWECNHALDCECGTDGLENKFERIHLSNDGNDVVGSNNQHPAPMCLWYQIVGEYTLLNLTERSDMLPALSGVAKAFAEKIQDVYVAGMWRKTLVANLLWYFAKEEKEDPNKMNNKTHSWRAPTWSWASRNCIAKAQFLPVTKELAEVKDIECQSCPADPTGNLESGAYLTLRTKALPATLEHCSDTPYKINLDPAFTISDTPERDFYCVSSLETGYLDIDTCLLTESKPTLTILLAQIASCTGDRQAHLYGHSPNILFQQEIRHYMVLARDSEDHWVRIGLVTIAEHEPYSALFGAKSNTLDYAAKAEMLKHMTLEEITMALDERAERNRAIFRRFNESEIQDVIIW